jgi:adenine-specific DNA-methyltransferase
VLVAASGAKRDVAVLDFFGGSGTTLHATMLLNAEDGQHRTCVLVTNNELKAETAQRLNRADQFRGDEVFEAAGVYRAAAYPGVMAAVRGTRPNGTPVPGEYLDSNLAHADGLAENVEFFRVDYAEAAEIEFGLRFEQLHPLLWLMAGAIGEREILDPDQPLGLPARSPYAVLFDPSGLPALLAALPTRPDITHVFVVADSADGFSQAKGDLPDGLTCVRLYRDYLEGVRGATR